jgi:hypothetical protein
VGTVKDRGIGSFSIIDRESGVREGGSAGRSRNKDTAGTTAVKDITLKGKEEHSEDEGEDNSK